MRNAAILEWCHAAVNDFRGCATSWTSTLRHTLLRADWNTSSRPTNQWTETLRHHSALSARSYPMGASSRFHAGGNPTAVLRFPQCHPGFRTLAKAVPEKARGTRRLNGWNKDSAALAEKDDARLSLRHSGAMWQGDISERLRRCCGEISAAETSTKPIFLKAQARRVSIVASRSQSARSLTRPEPQQ
jgi:hypothetical protein